ncbi:hypothetical protein HG531_006793 [Fusarium graminearum]|nr:hypothetical protein HG531_006793 [Fusarium graminearum]
MLSSAAYLCGLAGRRNDSLLELVALNNTEIPHISDSTTGCHQVQTISCETVVKSLAQPGDKITRVKTSVVSQNSGKLSKGNGEALDSQLSLTLNSCGSTLNGLGHKHLSTATAESSSGLLDGLGQDGKSIVQTSLSLIEELFCGTSENNCASLSTGYTGELDKGILTNDNLLDCVAVAKLDLLGVVKGGGDLTACHQSQTLNTVKVGMLN